MMNHIERGKEIFLAQLKEMAEGYKTIEECMLDNDIPVTLVEAFGVPEELREAFYAYHAEFLAEDDHETGTNSSGPFHNDEDVNAGVRNKFWYLYWPIVKLIERKYSSFNCTLIIEPHCQDYSIILVIAENRYEERKLPFPVVVLREAIKAWCMLFDEPNEPDHVFTHLFNLYDNMEQVCSLVMRAFNITNNFNFNEEGTP